MRGLIYFIFYFFIFLIFHSLGHRLGGGWGWGERAVGRCLFGVCEAAGPRAAGA